MRGTDGDGDGPGADAFVVVRDFLERLGDRAPNAEDVMPIRPALEVVYEKLMRLREISPAYRRLDLSDRLWSLMQMIGKKPQPAIRTAFGRAASFL